MVFKNFPNIKDKEKEKGITLVEIVVVVIIISMFSLIMISDFPEAQARYALSTVTHSFAQDARKAEDLALSGVKIKDSNGDAIAVKGYGMYTLYNSIAPFATKYLIYADLDNDHKYSNAAGFNANLCETLVAPTTDCLVSMIDISLTNPSLYIQSITDPDDNPILGNAISANFVPPDPTVNILDNSGTPVSYPGVKIILSNGNVTRTVFINNFGLISVQ